MSENKSSVISNVIWKFAERILAQLVSLIVSIVLARILMPEDYGAISMVTIFITIANVFVISGLPTALIQKKDADDNDFSSVFYANFVISVVLYAIIFLAAPYIAVFFDMPILKNVMRVLGLRIIVASINSVQNAYVSRNMMFRKYFWSTIFGTVISCGIGLALAYTGFGVWALVAQYMSNTIIGTIVLFITLKWFPKRIFSLKKVLGMFKYSWKILFEGVAETFTVQLRSLIIGRVYTSSDLGCYTKAQQFPDLIITNVSNSVSSVMFPAMSNVQDDRQRVRDLMRRSIVLTSYVMFPVMAGLALVAEPFILVLLTDKWIECVPYLQIFCFTQATTIGMIPRHEGLKSIGRSDVFMWEHMISRIASLLLLMAVFKVSVMAIALSLVAGSIIMAITVGITSKRYNGYRFRDQLFDVLPPILACAVMAVPVYFVGLISLSPFIVLALQALTGFLTYLLISIVFKFEGYIYIRDLIKRFLHSRKETKNV